MSLLNRNSHANDGFRAILNDCWRTQGFECPIHITDYITYILTEKLDKNPWQPEPSYVVQYLSIRTPTDALTLGNTCFFTRSVFPTLGKRHGISPSYYTQLGQGCYEKVLQHNEMPALRVLLQHFEFCAEMVWTAIHAKGEYREFWDLE